MKTYTVKQLAELAGVTVKTLHHYDEIGLLKPAERNDSDYRLYGEQELLRLQQILLYREMEMPLTDIKDLLDDPEFQLEQALRTHKRHLLQKKSRYQELIKTIDKTLQRIAEDNKLVTDAELYEGFSVEQRERYDREAQQQYGQMYELSQQKVRQLTKGQWKAVQAEGEEISQVLAVLIGRDPGDAEVQQLMKRHHAWIENFYPCSREIYLGLADLYVSNPEFTAHYERYHKGLAEFLSAAMKIFATQLPVS